MTTKHIGTVASRRAALACCALGAGLLAAQAARADDLSDILPRRQWVESWAAAPQFPVDPVAGSFANSLSDQTIRQVVRLSTGGRALRIRLTNEYGTAPVTIGAVHVALSDGASGIVPGSDRVVTFGGGQDGVTIPALAPALSDPVPFPVAGLTSLAVSLYVPSGGNPALATLHLTGQQTAYIVPGDQTGAGALAGTFTATARVLLSGVDTFEGGLAATVVAFGDSITDGFRSTVDADHRWPDYLAQRLQGSGVLSGLAVANEGISGNRVLADGYGPNALSRFDRDVLSRPGVRFVTLLEGINDIGFPNGPLPNTGPEPTADQIIAGYRQLIARAHERGVLIFGGTLTPYQGANYYTDAGEAIREAVNAFVRSSGEFDGVIDFDDAVRDPSNLLRFLPAYDSGDHLHPSDAGYQQMADSVDLRLFLLPAYHEEAMQDRGR